ncbi:MAG: sigma-70 family RNA polymerase sigma factor [Opitutaceae bacterium]|jgi:RNA polymerase sigma-70 factor (ECF subfamily)
MTHDAIELLRAFYAEERQHLYTYAVSITSNRESAEDAVHQAFQHLLRRRNLPADLRPYVFRCVRNAAIDAMRRTRLRRDTIFNESADNDPQAPNSALGEDLAALLGELGSDERESIVLKIYNDLTFQEIAVLRGVPVATAASWYRRGLEKMKTLMTETPHERA